MSTRRFWCLLVALVLPACGTRSDCGAETEEFSMREPLSEDEWGALSDDWSSGSLSDADCDWACGVAYHRVTDWYLTETTLCDFDVDTWGDTAALESSAAVVCSGMGAEFSCSDSGNHAETGE